MVGNQESLNLGTTKYIKNRLRSQKKYNLCAHINCRGIVFKYTFSGFRKPERFFTDLCMHG